MARRHHDVCIFGCLREVVVPSTSQPDSTAMAASLPTSTPAPRRCPNRWGKQLGGAAQEGQHRREAGGNAEGGRGEWKLRGRDGQRQFWGGHDERCSLNSLSLPAAVRRSRPKSYRLSEIGLSHQIHFSAVSHHVMPNKVWFVWVCFQCSYRKALPGLPFLIGRLVIFCCLFMEYMLFAYVFPYLSKFFTLPDDALTDTCHLCPCFADCRVWANKTVQPF